jgi:hypothetical protein
LGTDDVDTRRDLEPVEDPRLMGDSDLDESRDDASDPAFGDRLPGV